IDTCRFAPQLIQLNQVVIRTFPGNLSIKKALQHLAQLSIRIVYRNNSFYYVLMPGIWLSGVLDYLRLASVYYVYLIIKMTVIFAAHSNVAWDEKLYRIRVLRPLIWVLEQTISTPSTYSAHHGLTAVTHYKGNFGNLLFVWDVLFGTAKITRRRSQLYGIEYLLPIRWEEELFWSIDRSHRTAPYPS
ncbi:sterol desaturase family protein, partial [Pseudomonas koreensis]|uniref:sterol desaturase family protein n=1 Tax=Pseudomonas koreensis TaxID=198620 RepID=UPI00320BE97C